MTGREGEVVVLGAAEAARTLRRAAKALTDTSELDRDAAATALPGAVARAPRVTGALAASGGVTDAGALVFRTVYAGVVHNGWARRNITANPFAADAVEASVPAILTKYLAGIQSILNDVKGR